MKGFRVPVMAAMVNLVDNNHSSNILNGHMVCRADSHSWGQERRRRRSNRVNVREAKHQARR